MSAIRVTVTAEQITAAGHPHRGWHEPLSTALAELTGQDVDIDGGGGPDEPNVATIGQEEWTLVIDLPPAANEWLDARWNGEDRGPISFDIEVPDWIVALVARAATTAEQGDAVLRADGLA